MSCPLGWNITETAKDGPPEPDEIIEDCPHCGRPMKWMDGEQCWACRGCLREYSADLIEIMYCDKKRRVDETRPRAKTMYRNKPVH